MHRGGLAGLEDLCGREGHAFLEYRESRECHGCRQAQIDRRDQARPSYQLCLGYQQGRVFPRYQGTQQDRWGQEDLEYQSYQEHR